MSVSPDSMPGMIGDMLSGGVLILRRASQTDVGASRRARRSVSAVRWGERGPSWITAPLEARDSRDHAAGKSVSCGSVFCCGHQQGRACQWLRAMREMSWGGGERERETDAASVRRSPRGRDAWDHSACSGPSLESASRVLQAVVRTERREGDRERVGVERHWEHRLINLPSVMKS